MLTSTCRYFDKKPGYVRTEVRQMFAKVTDWTFMSSHCKHRVRHTKACQGVGRHAWARPVCAK